MVLSTHYRPSLSTRLLAAFGTLALLALIVMVTLLDSAEFRTTFLISAGWTLLLIGIVFARDRHWSLALPMMLFGIYFLIEGILLKPSLGWTLFADILIITLLTILYLTVRNVRRGS